MEYTWEYLYIREILNNEVYCNIFSHKVGSKVPGYLQGALSRKTEQQFQEPWDGSVLDMFKHKEASAAGVGFLKGRVVADDFGKW